VIAPGWHPQWWHDGESVTSVAIKLAYSCRTDVGSVLNFLVQASASNRLPVMFPSASVARVAIERLGLPLESAKSLFAGIDKPNYQSRRWLVQALRWCPTCMAQRFHSWSFQDWRRTQCSWHDEPLLDRCPRCHVIVDPMQMRAWLCPNCREPFARQLGQDWVQVLKRAAAGQHRRLEADDPRLDLEVLDSQDSRKVRILSNGIEPIADQEPDQSWNEAAWFRWHAWEQASAMTDSALHDHRDCVVREWVAGHHEIAITTYQCPLAAALKQALAWMGTQHEMSDGWPTSAMSSTTVWETYLCHLQDVPRWFVPVIAREVFIEWVACAAESFGESCTPTGGSHSWRPTPQIDLKWALGSTNSANVHVGAVTRRLPQILELGNTTCCNPYRTSPAAVAFNPVGLLARSQISESRTMKGNAAPTLLEHSCSVASDKLGKVCKTPSITHAMGG